MQVLRDRELGELRDDHHLVFHWKQKQVRHNIIEFLGPSKGKTKGKARDNTRDTPMEMYGRQNKSMSSRLRS